MFKAYQSGKADRALLIDVLLLNEEQFNAFAHGRRGETSHSIPATSGGQVD